MSGWTGSASQGCSPRALAAADAYAAGKILCPERFPDVDLDAKAEEIFTFLVGRPVLGRMKDTYGSLGRVADFLSVD